MIKWTEQELDELCENAIELLNKKKHLQLALVNCWLFSNSAGSNFHIVYHNEFLNQNFEITTNGGILQDKKLIVDKAAGLENIEDLKLKIALRIAYFIHRSCKRNMETK